MFPAILATAILLVGVIGVGSIQTDLLWKRYYGIERFWPEKAEPSVSPRSLSRRVRAKTTVFLGVFLVLLLPLGIAVDGSLGDNRIFYATPLSFFNPYDTFLQALGVTILLSSLLILTWAGSYLARYVYGTPPDQRSLLKAGPYRYVRHPFYLGFMLFGIGLVLLSLSYLMVLTLLYLLYGAYVHREQEERDLMKQYGKEYQDYANATGGFLPRRKPLKPPSK